MKTGLILTMRFYLLALGPTFYKANILNAAPCCYKAMVDHSSPRSPLFNGMTQMQSSTHQPTALIASGKNVSSNLKGSFKR